MWSKKCTLVQALRLCTGRTANRGSRVIALLFLDYGNRRWGVSVTPRPLFTPGKDPVPIVQEAGWALGPVWTGAENLASIGIRSPDRPARSQSLYRLRYPAHFIWSSMIKLVLTELLNKWDLPFRAHFFVFTINNLLIYTIVFTAFSPLFSDTLNSKLVCKIMLFVRVPCFVLLMSSF